MVLVCGDCGMWASVNSANGPLCLHCAFVRLTARRASTRFTPVELPPSKPVPPPPVTHFQKGTVKLPTPAPVIRSHGKTWPEIIADLL